mmetsp:Transcript_5140/g.3592  ORF Transcript_5140/g.3592 Transcript_5140/m.3592 type:complete len:218 (+) Transcript_5140:5445-6098(+)
MSDNHNVAVYNTETGALIGFSKGDTAKIIDCAFKDEKEFCTIGPKHFKSWTIGANLTAKRGNFGKKDQRIGSCAFHKTTLLTGAITGELYLWKGNSIGQAKKYHEKLIDAILVTKDYIMTGGRDCKVNILSPSNYSVLFSFSTSNWATMNGAVRSLSLSQNGNTLMVGTLGHEVFQVDFNGAQKKVSDSRALIHGHYAPLLQDNNEVWGLTSLKNKN